MQLVSYGRCHVIGSKPTSGVYMNGNRGLRVVAFLSIAIGIGILSRPAWGFVAFGLLVLIDAFIGPRWRDLYRLAIDANYRFLSFGDAMLLERSSGGGST